MPLLTSPGAKRQQLAKYTKSRGSYSGIFSETAHDGRSRSVVSNSV